MNSPSSTSIFEYQDKSVIIIYIDYYSSMTKLLKDLTMVIENDKSAKVAVSRFSLV